MKKKSQKTLIGLDEIVLSIESKNIKPKETELFSKSTGIKIGEITPTKTGFHLSINFPKMIRSDNVVPFTLVDCKELAKITDELKKQLEETFSVTLDKAIVDSVEINATAELEDKNNVNSIMNLLGLMFLQGGQKVYFTARGKKRKCYEDFNKDVLQNDCQIESLKTPRLSNKRFAWKFYNKGLEQGITDRGIIRFEQCHNSFSLDWSGIPRKLDAFLTAPSIGKLIFVYRQNFREYFINIFWKDRTHVFTDTCINTILYELQEESPLSVAKIHRTLIEIDFSFFEKACYQFYANRKTAQQTIRRIKNSGKIEVNKGAVTELVEIFRAIIY